jgi:hypothetical protein
MIIPMDENEDFQHLEEMIVNETDIFEIARWVNFSTHSLLAVQTGERLC